MDVMEFPDKLAELLARRNLSQKEVGILIGVDQARVSDWITRKSKRRPPLDVAYRLARVLDVPITYLADDAQDDPPPPEVTEPERLLLELMRSLEASPVQVMALVAKVYGGPPEPGRQIREVDIDPDTTPSSNSDDKPKREQKRSNTTDAPPRRR